MKTVHPIANPTYLADIRFLFEEEDMICMVSRGIDFRTYNGVKANALNIYFQVRDGGMPPTSRPALAGGTGRDLLQLDAQ